MATSKLTYNKKHIKYHCRSKPISPFKVLSAAGN